MWDVEQTELLADDDRAGLTSVLRAVRDAPHRQPSASASHWRDGEGANVTRLDVTRLPAALLATGAAARAELA